MLFVFSTRQVAHFCCRWPGRRLASGTTTDVLYSLDIDLLHITVYKLA
jgi:hypothetical protein